jgi:hypothetical protein
VLYFSRSPHFGGTGTGTGTGLARNFLLVRKLARAERATV